MITPEQQQIGNIAPSLLLRPSNPNPPALVSRKYLKDLEENFPPVKHSYSAKMRLNEEEAKLVKEKKVSLHDMVNYKREILLSKIKIENKKRHMKELEDYVNDLEKQINQKMDTMNKNTNIVRKNFHDLKKDVEQLKKDLNNLENGKKDKLAELSATENEIYQRELEKRKSEEEAKTYTYYKEFILQIFDHFNTSFDEKAFREFAEKLEADYAINDKAQFYLTENPANQNPDQLTNDTLNPVDAFVNMLETIEDDNFTLIYQLQNKEINNFELDRKDPGFDENSSSKLHELEKTFHDLQAKEKELRENLKESSAYEREVLNEVIYSKGLKTPSSRKILEDKDDNSILDIAEVKKKLTEILQFHDLPLTNDLSPLELLKVLEVYFEKLNYDATLIASTYPDYYQRRLREHTTTVKKDSHKAVENNSKRRQESYGLKIEERLQKAKMLKSKRKDMQKYVLKAEKKQITKNDFNPENFEYERYFI